MKNGEVILRSHTKWNQTAEYKCKGNYSLSNDSSKELHCNRNGEWDGIPGECIPG